MPCRGGRRGHDMGRKDNDGSPGCTSDAIILDPYLTFRLKTREFAHRMRMAIWTKLPGLTSRIHRPPETEDELAGTTPEDFHDANWNWEDAEKRLQAAYEKGGFPAWAAMALKEMEAEGRIERARRQKEYELASGKEASS